MPVSWLPRSGDYCGPTGTVDGQSCHHDTSRIAWAKLLARMGEELPLACPSYGGAIRLIVDGRQEPASFEPEVRKPKKARMASTACNQILTHLGEPLEPPHVSPARPLPDQLFEFPIDRM